MPKEESSEKLNLKSTELLIPFVIKPDIFDPTHIVIGSTKEQCYVASLKYLEKENFTVLGLMKTIRGNSHDESWLDKYTVIGDGGVFSDKFEKAEKRKATLYTEAPIVEHIEVLSDAEAEKWSQPFERYPNGEEHNRYICATRGNKKQYLFRTERKFIETPLKTDDYIKELDMYNNVFVLKVGLVDAEKIDLYLEVE